jgi:hypothetical protein
MVQPGDNSGVAGVFAQHKNVIKKENQGFLYLPIRSEYFQAPLKTCSVLRFVFNIVNARPIRWLRYAQGAPPHKGTKDERDA